MASFSTTGPPRPNLTAYARKFGQSNLALFQGTGKSGLTPVFLQSPNDPNFSQTRDDFDENVLEYQRLYLNSFTVNELKDLGAIDDRTARLGDLQNPIHDFYAKALWIDSDKPLGNGLPGLWSVNNPRVWDAISPCLRLASLFLDNMHIWPWFDALIYGPRTRIDTNLLNEPNQPPTTTRRIDTNLYNFEFRRSNIAAGSKESLEVKAILDYTTHVIKGWNFLVDEKETHGSTDINWDKPDEIHMGLSWMVIEPLLRNDLTVSERLVQQFHIVCILLHETAHAMEFGRSFVARRQDPNFLIPGYEPYFIKEDFAELGYSVENAIFGGTSSALVGASDILTPSGVRKVIEDDFHYPCMGMVTHSLPNWAIIDQYNRRFYEKGEDAALYLIRNVDNYDDDDPSRPPVSIDTWPITISLIQNLHTTAYWDCVVASLGVSAFRSPRVLGRRHTRYDYRHLRGADYAEWMDIFTSTGSWNVSPPIDLNDSLELWRVRESERTKAYVIHSILREQHEHIRWIKLKQKVLDDWAMQRPPYQVEGEDTLSFQQREAEYHQQEQDMQQLGREMQAKRQNLAGMQQLHKSANAVKNSDLRRGVKRKAGALAKNPSDAVKRIRRS